MKNFKRPAIQTWRRICFGSGFAPGLLTAISIFIASGCGYSQFAGRTTVTYKVTAPNGVITEATWDNSKDEQGIAVRINPATGEVTLKVEKSGANSEAITAASNANAAATKALADGFNTLVPIAKDALMMGAGVPPLPTIPRPPTP